MAMSGGVSAMLIEAGVVSGALGAESETDGSDPAAARAGTIWGSSKK